MIQFDAKEIAKSLARKSFKHFVRYTKDDYEFNWHHEALCQKLQDFADGKIKRLMVFMPPRHGKSELTSRRFPAWLLGRNPKTKIIATSYASELASSFNRDVQRIIENPLFHELFPDVNLNGSNVRTTQSWLRNNDIFEIVNHGGYYRCAGVGGAITGLGGEFLIIDDPFKNYEEAKSPTIRKKVFEWYTSTLYTRQEKNAGILLIQCMTGDTKVMLANGSEKFLKDIKVGDQVATYENGKLSKSKIKNWKSQGLDRIFTIKTRSGILVKANERHPFLVLRNGQLIWLRIKELQLTDKMIRVGEFGAEKLALKKTVTNPQSVKDFAIRTIKKIGGQKEFDHLPQTTNQEEMHTSNIDMELRFMSLKICIVCKMVCALYAKIHQQVEKILQIIGFKNFVSTIATKAEKLAGCFVMTATYLSNKKTQSKFCNLQFDTSDFTTDEIIEIKFDGIEEVFDIEVDRTENFIANGLVSHNTRWHEDDLAGMLLNLMKRGGDFSDQWDVINFPAILENENENDPRSVGEVLWRNKYDERWMNVTKSNLGTFQFSALYQQNPTPDEGRVVQSHWIQSWRHLPSHFDDLIQSWDMSFGAISDTASFVVGAVYGIKGSQIYLVDQVRGQWGFNETISQFELLTKRYPKAYRKLVEKKANGSAVIDVLKGKIQGIIPIEPEGSKESRFMSCQPLFEAGNVFYPDESIHPWVIDHKAEIVGFPNAKHNDRVDAESQALNHFLLKGVGTFTEDMADLKSSGFGFGEW